MADSPDAVATPAVSAELQGGVLVVEDNEAQRRLLRAFLEILELEPVALAATAQEALKSLEQTDPALALVDLALPDMDGRELIRRLRVERPGLQAIVLSGYADLDRVRSALASGARGYVVKGGDPGEICEAIRAVRAGRTYFSPCLGMADGVLG